MRFALTFWERNETEYCFRFLELDNNGYTWKDKDMLLSFPNTTFYYFNQDNYYTTILQTSNIIVFLSKTRMNYFNSLKQRNIKIGIITNGFTEFQMSNLRAYITYVYKHHSRFRSWRN